MATGNRYNIPPRSMKEEVLPTQKTGGPWKYSPFWYIRVGQVVEVDQDSYRMKIRWLQGEGAPEWMSMSFPYAGPAGVFGAFPEEKSVVICGFYNTGFGRGEPLPLAYLPTGIVHGLELNWTKEHPDAVPNEDINEVFRRFRDISDGDMLMMSSKGGQIVTNTDIELSDSSFDSLMLRHSDQSIIATSLNNYVFADGASVSAGRIVRNSTNLYDEKGKRIEDLPSVLKKLKDGRDFVFVKPFGDDSIDNSSYVEYRIDVDEICDGRLDINDINGFGPNPTSTRSPIVSLVMGNYVGNQDVRANYGKILRPIMFAGPNNSFSLTECSWKKGQDEASTLGVAYAIHMHNNDTFFGFDKEGQCFVNLGVSKTDPSNKGRSLALLAKGGRKEQWGSDAEGVAWDYKTKGGVFWDIGASTTNKNRRSLEIATDSGVYFDYGGEDDTGFAKQENIRGDSLEWVDGDKSDTISGDLTHAIWGLKTEVVRGSAAQQVHGDKSTDVMGVCAERVIKEKQGQFGARKVTVTGDDELTVQAADLIQTIMVFGNKKTSIMGPGNIEELITTGKKKITIGTGDFTVTVGAGSVKLGNALGSLEIDIAGNLTAKGALKSVMKAATVELGQQALGNVITTVSHKDYICGVPLVGTTTVKAGP